MQLRIYKNRIELQNPGGLFGRITIEEIGKKKNYDARNPNLIRILEDMGIVENRGSGIPTMIDEMLNHGLQKPEFDDIHGDFVVTFYGADGKDDQKNKVSNETLNETLNDIEKKIIMQMLNDNTIIVSKIAINTGIAVGTIKRYLGSMQKKGLIARIGAKKTGHWEVRIK